MPFTLAGKSDSAIHENLPRPVEEIYAKIPANHPFTIACDQDNPNRIVVTHLNQRLSLSERGSTILSEAIDPANRLC